MLSVRLMKCFALTVLGQVRLWAQVCIGPNPYPPTSVSRSCFYQTILGSAVSEGPPPQACSYWHQRLSHRPFRLLYCLAQAPQYIAGTQSMFVVLSDSRYSHR